jgi:hypothetical protein
VKIDFLRVLLGLEAGRMPETPFPRVISPQLAKICISFFSRCRQSSKMKMSKVGNQTNSQDPQAVNSRVFVGNLNTFQCSKTDVERMFQRYGRLAGERF